MTSVTLPDGHTDSYTYNGLGMRLTKQDPGGSYAYFNDGASPASDVLSDNFASFTPGISEMDGAGDRFYLPDVQGNSRGLLSTSQAATDGYNWDAFGTLISRAGSNPTAYAWGGGSGYQSDNDTGLKLLGHRYYDSRIGRFISQDHAKSGGNWYAYCNNNPTNKTDPSGSTPMDGPGSSPMGSPGYDNIAGGAAGWAENSVESEDFRDNYNQHVDQVRSAYFASQTGRMYYDFTDPLGSVGDLAHLIDPYLQNGTLKSIAGTLGYIGALSGAVNLAGSSAEEGMSLLGQGWNLFTTSQCSGALIPMGAGVMLRGAGMFGVAAFGTAAAIAGTAYLGWQAGTAISNMKQGNGLSVSDNLANSIWAPSPGM